MTKNTVKYLQIPQDSVEQRLDNFLFRNLKGIPKTHIYKLLRTGQFRVNKKRVKPDYRLKFEDIVRVPPLKIAENHPKPLIPSEGLFASLQNRILFEDDSIIVINKPSGLAVHGGTQVAQGLIDVLRYYLPDCKNLELAHRLDRDTSGCLILTKRREILIELHQLMREGKFHKQYLALVEGYWPKNKKYIQLPLLKNQLRSGERVVEVREEGKHSKTEFIPIKYYKNATLVSVRPITGRTHQIRVHAAHTAHPIAGDEKYGSKEFNRLMRDFGLKRLFLHASEVSFKLAKFVKPLHITAALDSALADLLERLPHKEKGNF